MSTYIKTMTLLPKEDEKFLAENLCTVLTSFTSELKFKT